MATAATPAKAKAVLIGATGAIGRCLLGVLLRDKEHYETVVVFGRRGKAEVPDGYNVTADEEETQGRLIQHVEDFDELSEDKIKELCTGSSVFFSCMGSTRSQAGSAQAFYHIDFELNMKFATAAKAVEIPHFSLVSSMGASPTSWIHYAKTKGQLEEAVKGLNFKCLTILRPGLLDRGQERRRLIEKLSMIVVTPMPVATVAEAMTYDANTVHSSSSAPPVTVANNTLIRQWAAEAAKTVGEEKAKDVAKDETSPHPGSKEQKPPNEPEQQVEDLKTSEAAAASPAEGEGENKETAASTENENKDTAASPAEGEDKDTAASKGDEEVKEDENTASKEEGERESVPADDDK